MSKTCQSGTGSKAVHLTRDGKTTLCGLPVRFVFQWAKALTCQTCRGAA